MVFHMLIAFRQAIYFSLVTYQGTQCLQFYAICRVMSAFLPFASEPRHDCRSVNKTFKSHLTSMWGVTSVTAVSHFSSQTGGQERKSSTRT